MTCALVTGEMWGAGPGRAREGNAAVVNGDRPVRDGGNFGLGSRDAGLDRRRSRASARGEDQVGRDGLVRHGSSAVKRSAS